MNRILVLSFIIMMIFLCPEAHSYGAIQDGLYLIYTGRHGNLTTLAYYKELERNGAVFEYYNDEKNNIKEHTWYKDGVPNGPAKFYYGSGVLKQVLDYKEGKVLSVKNFDQDGHSILE